MGYAGLGHGLPREFAGFSAAAEWGLRRSSCKGVWRNGSASDSRSEGWEFQSLCPHKIQAYWDPGWAQLELTAGSSVGLSSVLRTMGSELYTWPGSNWRPSACGANVIATRPQVLLHSGL